MEWVRYGRPAAEALRASLAVAKGDDPLAPATVVVPSNHVGVAARRLLASGAAGAVCERGTGLAAVTFLTVYRLAELLGASTLAAAGRRPVSTPVVAAALRAALRSAPGVFGPVAEHPSTETALLAAYRELRDLSPGALDRLAAAGPRAADVVRLHSAARAHLAERFYDEDDLMSTACDVLARQGLGPSMGGPVVVHLPERLSRHAGALLGALSELAEITVLAGTTGDRAADAEVRRSIARIPGLREVEPPASPGPDASVTPGRTRIVTTSDADEEIRHGVRTVMEAVTAGTPLDRIALLYAAPEPYARLVHDQLAGAGIGYNGAAVASPAARCAGRTLLGLLRLPERHFRRDEVFAWLAGARLHHHGRPAPVVAWERLSRDAGVVAGRDQWDALLVRLAGERRAEAARAGLDPEAPEWRAELLRSEAERAEGLRAFVLACIDDLAAAAARPLPWSVRARWARDRLGSLLGGRRVVGRWPLVEQRAAERVERALDRLACLDEVEGPVTLEVFVRTLELELDADLGRVGRMGDGVLVGSIAMGVGQDLDLLVVLGLAEGSFPTAVHEDSLLPDHERERTGGELALRADGVERQHRQLLAALAGATRHLLCSPRGDLRQSTDRVPSRWLLDVAGWLAHERVWSEDLAAGARPWLDNIASYEAGLRNTAILATAQEHRLRTLMAAGPGALPADDPVLGAGADAVAARRSSRFTRFDGNLAGLRVPSPAERPVSATGLETWAKCPFAYLARQVLRIEVTENPEDRLRISPADWGSLVHEVLERFVGEALARPAAEQPGPGEPWRPADVERIRVIAEEVCAAYEGRGLVGRPIFWSQDRRRILADLERLLELDSRHRATTRARPVAAELAFGFGGSPLDTVALPLPDGRSVRFRGKADRVDLTADGAIEVLDYKTGKADGYRGLSEADPDKGGTRLQLTVYGLAARAQQDRPDAEVRADYWFTSRRGTFKRIGYPVTDAVVAHVGATVGAMVAGIEAGVFPAIPRATSSSPFVECPYCDPDALGVADLARQLERKSGDPALAAFLDRSGDDEPGSDGD